LSPNAFINHEYNEEWLGSVTTAKRNFPRYYFSVVTKPHSFDVWATTEMDAFRTLYEMFLYRDFSSSYEEIYRCILETKLKLPTMLLKTIMEKAIKDIGFHGIDFVSEFAGQVLAQSGHGTTILISRCVFQPPAEAAFVKGMLSKADKNTGLTGLRLFGNSPFSSDQVLVRIMDGQVLKTFSFHPYIKPFSKQVLNSLRNNLQLQSLELCSKNFKSFNDFAAFVSSLHSSSLRKLTIFNWDFRRAAFPVEIFHKLLLMEFHVKAVDFTKAGWKSCRQDIPKCKTLNVLSFSSIMLWNSRKKKNAKVEFAVELAQLLKDSPNILSTTKGRMFSYYFDRDDDDNDKHDSVLYATHFAPILEHNRLTRNLIALRKKENDQVRGFLVAEAIGTRFAQKPSSCYTVLKANVDVLVSYLSWDAKAQEVFREAIDDAPESVQMPMSTTPNNLNKQKPLSKGKR